MHRHSAPFLLLAALLALPAAAGTPPPMPGARQGGAGLADTLRGAKAAFDSASNETGIQADEAQYDLDGWATLSGHAAVRYRGYELRADRIRYNPDTGDAEAEGNVVLVGRDDGSLWKGDRLATNLKERGGRADNVDLYTRPFRVLAADGAFFAPARTNQVYQIENATLTTCTNEPGHFHWCVTTRRARVRPGDDVTAWGVVPRLFGMPFFYYPYYWRDLARHYGFRFQPGYKHSWGPYLLGTYKLPVVRDKQTKAFIDSYTFADWRGDRGFAVGQKFAWEFGEDESHGYVTGWYMPKDDDPPPVIDPDQEERYRVRFNHFWNATDRDQVLMQALYVSDVRVMKDFFRREYREMTEPDNYATFTHYGDAFSAGLAARMRLNDLYGQVERLPEAWFELNALDLADTGVYLENQSAAAFLRCVFPEGSKDEDYDAFRADTHFLLSYPRKYLGFLSVVPRAGYRATYYDKTRISESHTELVTTVGTNDFDQVYSSTVEKTVTTEREGDAKLRSVFEVGVEVSSRAYGYWDARNGVRWRHVVEPYADFNCVPEPNVLPEELYHFDSIDRIDEETTLRLGVRQRWQSREPRNEPRERFYADGWLDFNLEAEEDEESFTGAGWDLRWYPETWMCLQAKGGYDNAESTVDNAEFVLTTWLDIFRCDVEYRYRHERSSLLTGYLTWYPNERWGFDIFGRYEFETSQVEEVGGWIQYSWDCFALRLIGSVEPSYTNDDGKSEEEDWSITLTGWLTDFVPARILEEDNR